MFCVYCGASMHDKANFCPKCGKPVKSAEAISTVVEITPVEDVVSAEEVTPIVENAATEEATAVEESEPVKETDTDDESTPIEEDATEEATAVEESEPVKKTDTDDESTPIEEAATEEATAVEESEPVKETDAAEESTPIEEAATEEATAVEDSEPVKETDADEESTPIEKAATEEATAVEDSEPVKETDAADETAVPVNLEKADDTKTAEQAVDKTVTDAQSTEEKPVRKKSTARKNLTATIAYIISAAAVAGLGLFVLPKLAFSSAFEKEAVSNSAEAAMTFHKASGDADAVSSVKFTIARTALDNEDYAYAAAVFAELKSHGFETEEDLASYVDEAFGGRCRVLVNGGKYNLAEADSTQISDGLIRASIVNDTLVSKAKILSAEGKTTEAYEMVSKVNTSAAYDSDSYNIIVYNYAAEFYNQMNFAETYAILEGATDEASVELRCSSAYYMANDFLKAKNYEKAIEMYENAGDFSDAKDRLKQCSYQLGLRYYNLNKLDTALEYFTAADGYKESASYIKKIEEKKAYLGWKIDGFTTDYVNTLTGRPNPEKSRIASTDPFIYYFTITNENNNKNGVTINVKITTPDGSTADETFTNVLNGDVNCYIAGYEFPQHGALGRAYFTVTLVETGEVLDTCYFEIY